MIRALKFAICVMLSTLTASALGQPPDGLCAIFGQFGRGTGFIVGDKFFSAAHVFEKIDKTFRIRCMQDGHFVDVTEAVTGQPHIHSQYLDSSKELKGVLPTRHTPEAMQMLNEMARIPYDVGYLQLSEVLKTKFIFDPSPSIKDTVELFEKIGTTTDFFFGGSDGSSTMADSVRTQKLGDDVVGADWEFSAAEQKFEVHGRSHGANGNAYLQPHHETKLGDSGGPLFYPSKDRQLVVVGIVFGRIMAELKLVHEIPPTRPGFFAPSKNIVSWLKPSEPNLFSKQCELELHSEKNAGGKQNL